MDLLKAFHNPDAKVGSSAFDLSCRRVFSSNAGECVPALVLDTVPGDKFKINMQAMMRSQTMDTAAFVRGKFNYDFFFVPYQQVWHRFLDFVNQKVDLHTSLYRGSGQAVYAPTIRLDNLLQCIMNVYESEDVQTFADDLGSIGSRGAMRLLNYLGYGNYEYLCDYWDLSDQDSAAEGVISAEIALLAGDDSAGSPRIYVNPFRLAAYQHIWYDIYRNKYFDTFSTLGGLREYPDFFNFDDVDCGSLGNSRLVPDPSSYNQGQERFYGLCTLHHCQWKKDIYTAVMPSQQFGVVSTVDFKIDTAVNTLLPSSGSSRVLSVDSTGKLYGSTTLNNSAPDFSSANLRATFAALGSSFDVIALRRSEALQKWKESALRAGNLADKNQKAHFGVDPYYYEENNVHFLGSFDGTFQVNPVTSQTQAGNGNNQALGDLAATGTSVVANGHDIEFDCRDYGIIMCISRFVPESEYSATGIERSNQRYEPFDYYTPEFANLGLQAVPLIEQSNDARIYADKNFVLGYAPRDYDYKQMQDKVYGKFQNYFVKLDYGNGSHLFGDLSGWVSPRSESLVGVNQGSPNGRGIRSFYVDPVVMNSVFLVDVKQAPQFIHQCWFDIKSIRKMPVLGLPEF